MSHDDDDDEQGTVRAMLYVALDAVDSGTPDSLVLYFSWHFMYRECPESEYYNWN